MTSPVCDGRRHGRALSVISQIVRFQDGAVCGRRREAAASNKETATSLLFISPCLLIALKVGFRFSKKYGMPPVYFITLINTVIVC